MPLACGFVFAGGAVGARGPDACEAGAEEPLAGRGSADAADAGSSVGAGSGVDGADAATADALVAARADSSRARAATTRTIPRSASRPTTAPRIAGSCHHGADLFSGASANAGMRPDGNERGGGGVSAM